jgi:hypothetical protein
MALRGKEAMFNAKIGDRRVIRGFKGTRDALGRLGIPTLVLSRIEPNHSGNGTAIGSLRRKDFIKLAQASFGFIFAESAGMIFGR